jgi:hypothetical protein
LLKADGLSLKKTGTPSQELRLFVYNKNSKNSSLKLLYLFNRNSVSFADLHTAFTTQTLLGIHRVGLAINHFEYIHWANVYTFLVTIALVLINCYFPHLMVTSLRVESNPNVANPHRLKSLYFLNRDGFSFADLHAAFTTQTLLGIHRLCLAVNHLEHIHWANVHTFLVARAFILVNCYFPHMLATSLYTLI